MRENALDDIGELLIPWKCGTTGNLDDGLAADVHVRDVFGDLKAQNVPSVCVLAAARSICQFLLEGILRQTSFCQ